MAMGRKIGVAKAAPRHLDTIATIKAKQSGANGASSAAAAAAKDNNHKGRDVQV